MSTFQKGELVIVYDNTRHKTHKIEIAEIVNHDVGIHDQIATIRQPNYAFEQRKSSIFKMPPALKKAIKEADNA